MESIKPQVTRKGVQDAWHILRYAEQSPRPESPPPSAKRGSGLTATPTRVAGRPCSSAPGSPHRGSKKFRPRETERKYLEHQKPNYLSLPITDPPYMGRLDQVEDKALFYWHVFPPCKLNFNHYTGRLHLRVQPRQDKYLSAA